MPSNEKRAFLPKWLPEVCDHGLKEADTLPYGFNLAEQAPPPVRGPVRELLNLNHVIEGVDAVLHAALADRAMLAYDLAPDLPLVAGDYRQIRRLLVNLMGDVAKAIGAGTGMFLLRTQLIQADRRYLAHNFPGEDMPEGKYAWLQISDIACALKEEDRFRIFEPFLTTKYAGRGLDLAAALAIVRAHEGAIAVTSKPGSSTTIKVLLPCEACGKCGRRERKPLEPQNVGWEYSGRRNRTGVRRRRFLLGGSAPTDMRSGNGTRRQLMKMEVLSCWSCPGKVKNPW
jgi:hypothetical protein